MELFPKTQGHQENSRKQDTRTLKTDPLFYHAGLRISTIYNNYFSRFKFNFCLQTFRENFPKSSRKVFFPLSTVVFQINFATYFYIFKVQ